MQRAGSGTRVQVERDTALLRVHPVEERRRSATGTVRPTCRLDLDDAKPALGQQRTAQRARPQRAEIDDNRVFDSTMAGRPRRRPPWDGTTNRRTAGGAGAASLALAGPPGASRSAGRPGHRAGRARDRALDETDRAMASHATSSPSDSSHAGTRSTSSGRASESAIQPSAVRKSRVAPPQLVLPRRLRPSAPARSVSRSSGSRRRTPPTATALRSTRSASAVEPRHQRSRWAESRRIWRTGEEHAATRGPPGDDISGVSRTSASRRCPRPCQPCWSLHELAAMRDTLDGGSTTCRFTISAATSSPPSRDPGAHSPVSFLPEPAPSSSFLPTMFRTVHPRRCTPVCRR